MKVATVITNRGRPDLTDNIVKQIQKMSKSDIYVVNMGKSGAYSNDSVFVKTYNDLEFQGKVKGHYIGIMDTWHNPETKIDVHIPFEYDYIFVTMNDLVFDEGADVIGDLTEIMENTTDLGILSPAELDGVYPGSAPTFNKGIHIVSTCDYLCFMLKAECARRFGFLNPEFKYSWGAIHEYAYKLNKSLYYIAYADDIHMKHLGGTTYGKVEGAVSRKRYQQLAPQFAARYFVEKYGKNWDEDFSKYLPEVEHNTFKIHRKLWESHLDKEERSSYRPPHNYCKDIDFGPEINPGDESRRIYINQQIESLNPWFYPVTIEGIAVTPGVGSKESANQLINRTEYRRQLIIDELLKRIDVTGYHLLDLGSNIAYWSSILCKEGAASLLAIEGRKTYVEQGELYWHRHPQLKDKDWKFVHGSVFDKHVHHAIAHRWVSEIEHSYDLTLCCGLLYHIPDYKKLVENMLLYSRQVLIDTRVVDIEEVVEEPGGWCFDSVVQTRNKVVPTLEGITTLATEAGFNVEKFAPPPGPCPDGLTGNDDYSKAHRVCLLLKKEG